MQIDAAAALYSCRDLTFLLARKCTGKGDPDESINHEPHPPNHVPPFLLGRRLARCVAVWLGHAFLRELPIRHRCTRTIGCLALLARLLQGLLYSL